MFLTGNLPLLTTKENIIITDTEQFFFFFFFFSFNLRRGQKIYQKENKLELYIFYAKNKEKREEKKKHSDLLLRKSTKINSYI